MSINFNKESVFNLKAIPLESVRGEVGGLLVQDVTIFAAFAIFY